MQRMVYTGMVKHVANKVGHNWEKWYTLIDKITVLQQDVTPEEEEKSEVRPYRHEVIHTL